MVDKHCEFEKDGKRCRAYKITNSKYCFTHSDDPEIVAMREEALKKAAESHKLYLPIVGESGNGMVSLPCFVKLDTEKGIKKAYIVVIKAIAQGLIDERRGGALVYALNGYVNAVEKIKLFREKEEQISKEGQAILDKYIQCNRQE